MANAPRDDATIDNSDLKARMMDMPIASGSGVLAFIPCPGIDLAC
jgi:hypothetical protein